MSGVDLPCLWRAPALVLALAIASACTTEARADEKRSGPARTVIAFGSGNNQNNAQPLWGTIASFRPAAWIWLGDAIRPTTSGVEAHRRAFEAQFAHREYSDLIRSCRLLGIWNRQDSGFSELPKDRAAIRNHYLDFIGEPALSPRRRRQGLYAFQDIGVAPRLVRVILLDLRSLGVEPGDGVDPIGAEQWSWLEETFSTSPATFHLIASPIPVLPREIDGDKLADYGKTRDRLIALMTSTALRGAAFISGGRSLGEMTAQREKMAEYTLVEATAGGMTHFNFRYAHDFNKHRVGEVFVGLNFGLFEAEWEGSVPRARIRLVDQRGQTIVERRLDGAEMVPEPYKIHIRGPVELPFD